jgi:hypothetical protein
LSRAERTRSCFLYFDLGQSDDGEIRQPVGEMNLNGDRRRFHAASALL